MTNREREAKEVELMELRNTREQAIQGKIKCIRRWLNRDIEKLEIELWIIKKI